MELEDFMAVNYHVARGTLKIDTGSFYDKWSFIWFDTIVLATVSRFNGQIHLVTDVNEEISDSILEFIEMEKENVTALEDEESWN